VAVLAHSVSLAQAELSSVRTALSESERKAAKATKELAVLEERWIAKVQADAEQLNEANVFYQQMNREKKNLALLRQAQEEEFTLLESKSTLNLPTVGGTKSADVPSPDSFARAAASALGLQQSGTPTTMVRSIAGGGGETTSVAFDPSGSLIATGGADATVQVWDGLSGARRATLRGASKSIMSIELSPSGERLVASSNDHAARIWTRPVSSDDILSEMLESTTGGRRGTTGGRDEWTLAQTLTGHMQKVFASTFSADGLRVVTGSHDRTIKIWDATKGTCFRTIFCFSSCNAVVMSMDGGMVTSGHLDNSVRMWSTRSGESLGEMLRDHRGQVTSLTQNPMNESLLLSASRDNQLRLLDVRMHSVVQSMGDPSLRTSVNWARATLSPDGTTAALGGADGIVYCFDVRTCKVVQRLRSPSSTGTGTGGAIAASAWNPRGCQLAVVDRTGTLRVWS
jgi:autophagy-related protein 16